MVRKIFGDNYKQRWRTPCLGTRGCGDKGSVQENRSVGVTLRESGEGWAWGLP